MPPISGVSVDQIVDSGKTGGVPAMTYKLKNGVLTDPTLGPAAKAYYKSLIKQLHSWGVRDNTHTITTTPLSSFVLSIQLAAGTQRFAQMHAGMLAKYDDDDVTNQRCASSSGILVLRQMKLICLSLSLKKWVRQSYCQSMLVINQKQR